MKTNINSLPTYFIRFYVKLVLKKFKIVKYYSSYSNHNDKGTMVKFRTNYWSKLHNFIFFGSSKSCSSIKLFRKYFENNWKIFVNQLNLYKTSILLTPAPPNWTTIGPELCFIRFYADISPYKIAILVTCSHRMWEADK